MSSGSVANALQKCFVKLGPPNQIVADNARNLQGPEVLRLLESFKVKLTHSSEYYPKGNAVCERVHRTLHKLARTYGLNSPELLRREFQKLVHVYNSRPHKALSYRCPYEVLFGRNPSFSEHGQRQYDLRDLYEIWDDVRLHQAQQFRNNKLGYDRRHNVKQRMSGDYAPGQDVLLYQRRIGSLGVGNKLQDVFQRGWKIVQGPSLRYPNTVLITNGKVTKTINLRYVKVDKSLEKGVKELPVSPAKVNIKEQKTDNCSIELESDDDSIAVNDDNEDCENVVRRSTRRKIAVRRLSLGLGKSQSYEDKILK
ncbi:hypothetical protein FOL47_003614 [Perkinsus chesapeaki]|uniref:Integrase catalytic domain-containing protein n=1 Tax=Perkinsus chesapeaki TaxID=330153 RepID=A0A7J6M6Y4_PERCH|nr:hypothetical protein FOL47_003614 [Perkinsus chesapeaki]